MQGAGLNVILKVYRLHDMHPGNMWNTDKAHGFHGFSAVFIYFWKYTMCKLQIVDVERYICMTNHDYMYM